MPQIDLSFAILGCAATCAAYAAILSTKRGRKFTVRHTWATVVLGVLFVLGWLATTDVNASILALAFFVDGGAPMIVRSWWLEHLYQQDRIDYLQHELDHERKNGGDGE